MDNSLSEILARLDTLEKQVLQLQSMLDTASLERKLTKRINELSELCSLRQRDTDRKFNDLRNEMSKNG